MAEGLCVAVLGAESTGKTTLAAALAPRLARETGLKVCWVPELLREWCHEWGRTPRADEQSGIARAQHERIAAAAATHDLVLCDTTALMTAVYSRMVFADRSLDAEALALHRPIAMTLLTALDLPWVPDGIQRDGPHVREPVDRLLREFLIGHRLPWALVSGHGAARVESALDALAPLLRPAACPRGAGSGLFTRLAERNAEPAARAWTCTRCDDAACEHRLFAQRA